jgi:hypothetical protein
MCYSAPLAFVRRQMTEASLGRATKLVLCGIFICFIAIHPSHGRAQTPEDDWREIRPSAVPTETSTGGQDPSTGTQDSDSPSLGQTTATGTISGLRSGGNPEMELRLRRQSNGFLHGELVIHQSGFGMTPLDDLDRHAAGSGSNQARRCNRNRD